MQYQRMINYVHTLYFELCDIVQGVGIAFDESWIEDLREVSDEHHKINDLIHSLMKENFGSAIMYCQDILDSDQMLAEIEDNLDKQEHIANM